MTGAHLDPGEPLGDRQWPYLTSHYIGYVYADDHRLSILGAVALTPDQARDLADTLRQAADDLDGQS